MSTARIFSCCACPLLTLDISDAIRGQDGQVAAASLVEHLKVGRIQLLDNQTPVGGPLMFSDLAVALSAIDTMKIEAWAANDSISMARIALPDRWALISWCCEAPAVRSRSCLIQRRDRGCPVYRPCPAKTPAALK